ncbi:MAG: response regulator [Elusimicrobiota bacterium]
MERIQGSILIVDDEEPVRRVCERMLRESGLEVRTEGSAQAALSALNARSFDCVLTDLQMPGSMDGVGLVSEIHRLSPRTAVVVMTGEPTVATAVTALKAGACEYLPKPFQTAHLVDVVRHQIEKARLSRELDRERFQRLELEAMYAELQKVERMKDAFLSRLNHEFRTPLAAVSMSAELLCSGGLSAQECRRLGEVIRGRIGRLAATVEDLLLFSETRSGKVELKPEDMDLRVLAEECLQELRPLQEESGLRAEVDFEPGSSAFRGDRGLLRRAFRHLLLNAIRFNRPGGTLKVEGRREDGRVVVRFSDSGLGLPEGAIEKLFDGFYQAASHLTRKVGGLGLGLALTRRIVEAHGGAVGVESTEGSGSVFSVAFPGGAPDRQ